MSWAPDGTLLQQVVHMLSCSLTPDTAVQRQAYDALAQYARNGEFVRYLAYVFARGSTLPSGVRAAAGLALKNTVSSHFSALPADVCASVQDELLATLGDADSSVRSTGANAISSIVLRVKLMAWPALVTRLVELLDGGAGSPAGAAGALAALLNLSEDVGSQFESAALGHPLTALFPRLLAGMRAPDASYRVSCARVMNNFVAAQPASLAMHLDDFLSALSALTSDGSPGMRCIVSQSLVSLTQLYAERVWPHLPAIQAFQLSCLSDFAEEDVALAACEFWATLAEKMLDNVNAAGYRGDREGEAAARAAIPPPTLAQLVRLLCTRMAYSDEELSDMSPEDLSNEPSADRAADVRPHIARTKESAAAGSGGVADVGEDEEGE